jgi:hypothetical protein
MEWFQAAANQVRLEMEKHPGIPIPVDPEVAEFMGAFEETALSEEDFYCDEEAVLKKLMLPSDEG